jgi:hypothetical protein
VPPDDEERVLTGGSSPVELACAEGAHTYWVRARDHAWSRITVFVGFGGERVVRLVRGGALDVRLKPFDPEHGIKVVLTGPGLEFDWHPDDSGHARIEGLPPGRYEIRVEAGRWPKKRVLAQTETRIDPGATTELALPLGDVAPPADPPAELVPLAGTLHVSAGWSEEDEEPPDCMTPSISAVSLLDDSVHAELEEEGRWSADPVRPGRYLFRVSRWTWLQDIEVGPGGNTEVRLVVPPPCDVEVHLVDEKTGDPIAADGKLVWCVKSADIDPGFSAYRLNDRFLTCVQPGLYRFRAPVGMLEAGLFSDLLDADDMEVALRPGRNRVDMKVVWTPCIDFAFKDGTMPVPADTGFSDRVEVAGLDNDGELLYCPAGDPLRVEVTKPGRYRVLFPAGIEGYEPIAPLEVEIAAGKIPRIEVQLSRRGS